MKGVIVLQNKSRKRPGFIFEELKRNGFDFDIVHISKGETVEDLETYSAMIVLGGSQSVNDENQNIEREIAVVRQWLGLDRPYLGICLGMQVLVRATGGKVMRCKEKEIGFRSESGELFEVEILEKDDIFEGLPERFNVFHFHSDTVELSDSIELIGEGNYCPNQIIIFGDNAYGVQFHPELTANMLQTWLSEDNELRNEKFDIVQKDFQQFGEIHEKCGRRFFRNFLSFIHSYGRNT